MFMIYINGKEFSYMKKIVIGICTYKRNDLLDICLNYLDKMVLPAGISVEIVIVDNSPEAMAKTLVEAKKLGHGIKLHYFSFLGKGIAAVRNKVLTEVLKLNPDYIAFTDDDQYPCENWLMELYTKLTETGADVVSGPVLPSFINTNFEPLAVPDWIKNNSRFEGKSKRADGVLCNTASTNNVLLKTEILDKMDYWFDESYLKMTGEDIDFFDRIHELGFKIVWCKNAAVYEIVDPKRCTIKFLWRRNYNNGYLKIYNKKKKNCLKPIHIITSFSNLILFLIVLPLSIFCGLTVFFEMFGKLAFSLGSFVSLFKSKALVHYKD